MFFSNLNNRIKSVWTRHGARSLETSQPELSCEVLERRDMLTAFIVNTTKDVVANDGLLSLREAIQASNNNATVTDATRGSETGDTITFAASLAGATIKLTNGRLTITDDLIIAGDAANPITIDAGSQSQHFSSLSEQDISISNVRLINGLSANNSGGTGNGGSIELGPGVFQCTLTNVEFVNCNATNKGGAVYGSDYADLRIDNCKFDNDHAAQGGAVFLFARWFKFPEINNTQFIDNSAAQGGAVYLSMFNTDVIVQNTTFMGNDAEKGGAVYVTNPNHFDRTLQFVDATFQDNTASRIGGAIYSSAARLLVQASSFDDNGAADPASGNTGDGGAIYLSGSIQSNITASTFNDNYAERDGGAIFTDSNTTVAFHNSDFTGNLAKGNLGRNGGGTIYNNGGVVRIFDAVFTQNRATGPFSAGGAIATNGGYLAIRSNTSFTQNRSNRSGGAIDIFNGNGRLEDISFGVSGQTNQGNSAGVPGDTSGSQAQGGALAVSALAGVNTVLIVDCGFYGNFAYRGGAILIGETSIVQFVEQTSTIEANEAVLRGGGILVGGTLEFDVGVTISGNSAGVNGGGVFKSVSATIESLENATLENNTPNDINV